MHGQSNVASNLVIAFWFRLAAQKFCDWLIDLAQFVHPPIRTKREKEKTSYPQRLIQRQAKCEATDMKISLFSPHKNSLIASFWKWEFFNSGNGLIGHLCDAHFPSLGQPRSQEKIPWERGRWLTNEFFGKNQFGNVISVISLLLLLIVLYCLWSD